MAYFLFSYAWADHNQFLHRFYEDLREEARLLVGVPLAQVGFRDAISIDLSARWSDVLVDELMTCKVFVALCSPTYFLSENCGKEWAAFYHRMELYAEKNGIKPPPSIIPVLWAPIPEPPKAMSDIQWTKEEFGDMYRDEGLLSLMRRREHKQTYRDIVRALAIRIRDVARQHCLPEPQKRFVYEDVVEVFPSIDATIAGMAAETVGALTNSSAVGSGPKHVNLVIVAGRRDELAHVRKRVESYGAEAVDWMPYNPPDARRISSYAQSIISRRDFTSQLETVDSGLSAVLARAATRNELVVILVDVWSIKLERYRQPLQEYDERNEPSVVIMVPANGDDPEAAAGGIDLTNEIREALPRNFIRRDVLFKDRVSSIEDFRRTLVRSITLAQDRIFSYGPVAHTLPSSTVSGPPPLTGP